jgi:hypothetical protein
MQQARKVEIAPDNAKRERLAKKYGIKGIPVLSSISSISFPFSFPFDFMHLIWQNLIPNLIDFWTGKFKGLNHENEGYFIDEHIWDEIGAATAACGATIPAAFGAPVPNIATKRHLLNAEMHANWTLYIAPIVLQGRFKRPQYYQHFLRLVELLKICLSFEISEEMLIQIEEGFRLWVEEYEK